MIIKTCMKLFLVLLFIFALVGLWRHRVEWSCANVAQCAQDTPAMSGTGSGFPISVLGSTILDEDEMAGGIAVLTDTAMTVYNTNSKQAVSHAHYLSTPAMKTAGRYALLVDIGGTKYRVETVSETIADSSADYPLIGGAVAQNGTYAIVMQGSSLTSMLSSVYAYDRTGKSVYKWHSSEYYITDAALSADGKYIALCGIAADDGKLQSCVFIHKVSTNTELVKYPLADTTCLSLGFSNTGTLFAVCSDKVVTFSNYSDNVSTVALSGTLQAYDISCDSGAAIYTAQVSNEEAGTLTLLDSRGTVRCTKDVSLHAIAVSLSDSDCCVLGRGGIEAYKLNGEAIGSWTAEASASDVLLIGGCAYVVEGISISQVRLSHDLEQ